MDPKKIQRINYLAKKSKESYLTEEEKKEQQELRKEYIDIVKRNFRKTLDCVEIVDE